MSAGAARPRPCIFLDRDGTLTHDVGYTHRLADYALLPGVIEGLRRLAGAGFDLIVVTNQSGIGRGLYAESDYRRFQARLEADLEQRGLALLGSYHCPHRPDAGCACRKPSPGLVLRAAREHPIDVARSFVIGDSAVDVGLAREAGCTGAVLVLTGHGTTETKGIPADVPRAQTLEDAAGHVVGWPEPGADPP